MQQPQVMRRIVAASGVMLLMAGGAAAQSVFRAASTFQLTGAIGDATSLFALVDVGSQNGPPDRIADIVTAAQNQFVTVLFGNGDGTFDAGPNTPLGRIPSALVVADFNGDGLPDLLIGDVSNTVAFFAGTGSPDGPFIAGKCAGGQNLGAGCVQDGDCPKSTCALFPPFPAGIGPVAIAAADVNGDGKLDALVVDEGNSGQAGAVTVLFGVGDGTFIAGKCAGGANPGADCARDSDCPASSGELTPPTCALFAPFPAGGGSAAVAVADFNGDGKPDLAVVNKGSNNVTIMRGAGHGFFTTVQTVAVGQEPIAIAAADLNADGRIDLVVTNRNSDSIAVIDGLAGGSFGSARFFVSGGTGSAPTGLALGDVNHDGALDVLVPNNRTSDASVLLGDGHGNFAAPRIFVTDQEPLAIAAADVNGDDVTDAVCVNRGYSAPDAAVLLSRADGSFDAVEDIVAQASPTGLTAGDVDNDGVSDLILAQSPTGPAGGTVLVYRATPPLGFAAPISLQAAGDAVAVGQGDFNADGRLDIAVVNSSTSNVSVFLGLATGGFGAAHNYPIGSGATAVAVGDWNHDGRSDLAVAEQGTGPTGVVEILLARADGSFGTPKAFPVGLTPVSIDRGDFNEDGKPDLAVANNVSGSVSVLKGNGDGTFTALSPIANLGSARALVVADFDRDHHDDIAVVDGAAQSRVDVYFGTGQGSFGFPPRSLSLSGGNASALAARDINGDSKPDLLVSDDVSNAVAIFTSQGANQHFTAADTVTVSRRPISVAAADFDGDGRYDGAAADAFVGTVSVLTNIVAPAVLRGDANGDAVVSAADAVAVMRELADGNGTRIEEVTRGGTFAAAPGVDANGDGVVTPQDALAVAYRLFAGS
jgi:hypothetical protein